MNLLDTVYVRDLKAELKTVEQWRTKAVELHTDALKAGKKGYRLVVDLGPWTGVGGLDWIYRAVPDRQILNHAAQVIAADDTSSVIYVLKDRYTLMHGRSTLEELDAATSAVFDDAALLRSVEEFALHTSP